MDIRYNLTPADRKLIKEALKLNPTNNAYAECKNCGASSMGCTGCASVKEKERMIKQLDAANLRGIYGVYANRNYWREEVKKAEAILAQCKREVKLANDLIRNSIEPKIGGKL